MPRSSFARTCKRADSSVRVSYRFECHTSSVRFIGEDVQTLRRDKATGRLLFRSQGARRPAPECKACNLARRAAKYAHDPTPYIERVKRWQQENPERLNAYRQ